MALTTSEPLIDSFSKLSYVITIRLLRAELSDDIDADAHAWWIQHHYRVAPHVLEALWSEAKRVADGYRYHGEIAQVCQDIDTQLSGLGV